MTAQISDGFLFENKEYYEIAITNPLPFAPEDYGLKPVMISTACWRGYWCDYELTGEQILLKNLHVRVADDVYPTINGVSARFDPDAMNSHTYTELNLPMDYTGKIVLGDDFLNEYYVHMGFQSAWAFGVVKEFEFNNGKIIAINDYSEQMVKMRELIDRDPEGFYENMHANIPRFIDDVFSQDYAIKAWWLINN
jgi:hypothetical protein